MAMFKDDSTDDETCYYLQLGERLRINRGEPVSSRRSAMSGKEKKQLFNQQRQKHIIDEQSSSSSSFDMQNETPFQGPMSSHSHQNKKRQNGDKPIDQLTNPKRTCLDDACQRSPGVSGCRKKTTNGDIPHSRKIMDFSAEAPNSSTRSLFPDSTYEDHASLMKARNCNQVLSDDSDIEIWPRQTRKTTAKKAEPQRPVLTEVPLARTQGVQSLDSASEEDSKAIPTGALKGGRQSPDPTCTKKVVGRKEKRVLESDDSESEDWPAGYRARPLIFSSSDSEDSKPLARLLEKKTEIGAKKSANLSFPSTDPRIRAGQERHFQRSGGSSSIYDNNFHPPAPPRSNFRTRSPSYKSYKTRASNRTAMFPSTGPSVEAPERFEPPLSIATQQRTLRSARNGDVRASSRPGTNSAPQSHSGNTAGGEASTIRFPPPLLEKTTKPIYPPSTLLHARRYSRTTFEPDPRLALGRSRPRRARPNLAAAYPDIFDAEDSSEVEFFTANSYSDNESNTEPVSNLLSEPRPALPLPVASADCPVNVSSEDEISVVYANCMNPGSARRRGISRLLGRRHSRGARRHLSRRPDPSLSPDPVEQVRQVEDDERFARMLQAQFDAEADPTYNPVHRGPVSPNPCQMNIREYSSSSSDSSLPDVTDDDLANAMRSATQIARRRVRAHPAMLTPDMFRRPNMSVRINVQGARHQMPLNFRTDWNTWNPRGVSFSNLVHFSPAAEDTYEAFLGLAEMNGDVTRGLQKSQINRLPTRKFAILNGGASGSGEVLPHKRAELNKECQVCLNDYVTGDVLRILPCFHEFHTPCIDPWLKINHTCPVCRVVVNLED